MSQSLDPIMGMKNYQYVEDHNGEQVTLHELCYMIYQGFGQDAVHNFIDSNTLYGVTWHTCDTCEVLSPIFDNGCLVCGNTVRQDK